MATGGARVAITKQHTYVASHYMVTLGTKILAPIASVTQTLTVVPWHLIKLCTFSIPSVVNSKTNLTATIHFKNKNKKYSGECLHSGSQTCPLSRGIPPVLMIIASSCPLKLGELPGVRE